MAWTPGTLHEALCASIEGIVIGSTYSRQDAPDDAWRRSIQPLQVETSSSEAAHLSFSLLDGQANDGLGQGGSSVHVNAPMVVRFQWMKETSDLDASYQRALEACAALFRHLLNCPVSEVTPVAPDGGPLWDIDVGAIGDYWIAEVYITYLYDLALR